MKDKKKTKMTRKKERKKELYNPVAASTAPEPPSPQPAPYRSFIWAEFSQSQLPAKSQSPPGRTPLW
jgi:hypothetical protein